MTLGHLPALRDVIAAHGLQAKKTLGQHFLLDLNLTRKIVRTAGALKGHTVIEIGPGPGGLTRILVDSEASAIIGIEKDPRCINALQSLIIAADGRLRIIEADALAIDPTSITPAPRSIIANLPYNVGTAMLTAWLQQAQDYAQMVLMFQKEVAERITAQPRTPAYGRLSVLSQFTCDCFYEFTVPASAFTPPPKVDSAIVRLVPKKQSHEVSVTALERVTAAAFGQRRKMLRSIFKNQLDENAFTALGIKPEARAEELHVSDFVKLAAHLQALDKIG